MRRYVAVIALCCCVLVTPAWGRGWYGGVSVGEGKIEPEGESFRYNLDDTGWAAYFGYRMFKYFAVEGRYADFGASDEEIEGVRVQADAWAGAVYGYGILPASPRVDLFAKVGVSRWDLELSLDEAPLDDDGVDFAGGIGVSYRFSPRVGIRVEWERYDFGDVGDATLTSIGVHFGF